MNKDEQYFVELLKCFLHSKTPVVNQNINWDKILEIAKNQQLTGIIGSVVLKLPNGTVKSNELYLKFVQYVGLETGRFDEKEKALKIVLNSLINKKIKHLIIKGAVLKYYYPAPELRSSGDTDIVVDAQDYNSAIETLKNAGFTIELKQRDVSVLKYGKETFEIHNNSDVNIKYFDNWQTIAKTNNSYTYQFNDTNHLLYIVSHIIKHIKVGGIGIRMIADIDVLAEKGNINYREFYKKATELGVLTQTKMLIAFSKKLLDSKTVSDYDFDNDLDLYNKLCQFVIDNKTYGIENSIGVVRLQKHIKPGKKPSIFVSIKAFLSLFVVPKEVLQNQYEFCAKYPVLLPIAYICKIFCAAVLRKNTTKNNISSIFTRSNDAKTLNDILTGLKID